MGNFIVSYRFVLHNFDDAEVDDTSCVVSSKVFICKSPSIYFCFLKYLLKHSSLFFHSCFEVGAELHHI